MHFSFYYHLHSVPIYEGSTNTFSNWRKTTAYAPLVPTTDNLLYQQANIHTSHGQSHPPPFKFWNNQKKNIVSCSDFCYQDSWIFYITFKAVFFQNQFLFSLWIKMLLPNISPAALELKYLQWSERFNYSLSIFFCWNVIL